MYRYFISYTYYLHNGNYGTGNGITELDRRISSVKEVQFIEDDLKRQMIEMYPNLKGKPVLMHFIEL